jgi:hypothetical protein
MIRSRWFLAVAVVIILAGLLALPAAPALGVPLLQLYIEGATYDTDTETWLLTLESASTQATFRLWAVGNVDGPGGKGTILEVRLAVAYAEGFADDLAIQFTPSTTGGYGGVADPSLPAGAAARSVIETSLGQVIASDPAPRLAPDGVLLVDNGGTPVLGDGRNLPSHGVYGPGVVWREYDLGDFWRTDSPVGDFIGAFPAEWTLSAGQIDVFEVTVTSVDGRMLSGATIHFDLYNHIEGWPNSRAVFSPFSHAADAEVTFLPEPATVLVWSLLAACGAGAALWRRRDEAPATTTRSREG